MITQISCLCLATVLGVNVLFGWFSSGGDTQAKERPKTEHRGTGR